MAKDDKRETKHDAVAFGLTMQLPDDALRKYAVGKWSAARLGPETVDDDGQRWLSVSMPIGPRLHSERSDKVVAIALVKTPDGYSCVRLEMPLQVAASYAVETTEPDQRGHAVDRGQRMLEEAVT